LSLIAFFFGGIKFLATVYRGCGTGKFRGLAAGQHIFLRRSPAQNDQLGLYPFFPVVFHVPPIAFMASFFRKPFALHHKSF
jgi:hypothetical protein